MPWAARARPASSTCGGGWAGPAGACTTRVTCRARSLPTSTRTSPGDPGPGGGTRCLLPRSFAVAMRRLGVRGDEPVVVYDDTDASAAARAWWLLRFYGQRDVRVLDGGWRAWRRAGHPTTTEPPVVTAGDFAARVGTGSVLDAQGAADVAQTGVLLDARAGERYRGEVEPVDPVAGHIPGARSAPTAANLAEDGRFQSAPALRERFAALGVTGEQPVGVYCGSGVTAAHEILALEVAGITSAALYVGSWSDWITDASRPIATGP